MRPDAIAFLRNLGILGADKTQFIVTFDDGRQVDFVQLMEQYKAGLYGSAMKLYTPIVLPTPPKETDNE